MLILICAQNALLQFGNNMCWMCGCADHIGLGNERPSNDLENDTKNDIIIK